MTSIFTKRNITQHKVSITNYPLSKTIVTSSITLYHVISRHNNVTVTITSHIIGDQQVVSLRDKIDASLMLIDSIEAFTIE